MGRVIWPYSADGKDGNGEELDDDRATNVPSVCKYSGSLGYELFIPDVILHQSMWEICSIRTVATRQSSRFE